MSLAPYFWNSPLTSFQSVQQSQAIAGCLVVGALSGILIFNTEFREPRTCPPPSTCPPPRTCPPPPTCTPPPPPLPQGGDPCASKTCSDKGTCKTAACSCQEGYCGADCRPSSEMTGESCPCEKPNSLCVEGKCRCRCGYFYASTRGNRCLYGCENGPANEFTLYEGKRFSEVPLVSLEFLGPSSEEQRMKCEQKCLEQVSPVCLSYAFYTASGGTDHFCYLFDFTKGDKFPLLNTPGAFYQRKCL